VKTTATHSPVKAGPTIKRFASRQDYQTPQRFIRAVEARFGNLHLDLAADASNTKCEWFIDRDMDSLKQPWSQWLHGEVGWLNPPFGDCAVWARKCAEEAAMGAKILLLTPASVGANWFSSHIHGKTLVLALSPRLSFDGKHPFPKDCLLSCYNLGPVGFDCWRWTDQNLPRPRAVLGAGSAGENGVPLYTPPARPAPSQSE
jgi:phage N-6-adenine-methyltransferase